MNDPKVLGALAAAALSFMSCAALADTQNTASVVGTLKQQARQIGSNVALGARKVGDVVTRDAKVLGKSVKHAAITVGSTVAADARKAKQAITN